VRDEEVREAIADETVHRSCNWRRGLSENLGLKGRS
jgi:hypothetical protein